MVSLDKAALPWWLFGAAGLCFLLALSCLCRSLMVCRQLNPPIPVKQDLEVESREIVHKISRFGVSMKRLDIQMDDYAKERNKKQKMRPGGEALSFMRDFNCCSKLARPRGPPRTLREEVMEERKELLSAD
jgi:hypothetical protein